MNLSPTEENYLKVIFKLSGRDRKQVSTNAISHELDNSAASVTDMLKRLKTKKLVQYERYKGAHLSKAGEDVARTLIRNHRLWEVFLMERLGYKWDEVHEIAEQLEHIKSDTLVSRLDEYLGNPRFDPHGDPIPDAEGNIVYREQISLAELPVGQKAVIGGVKDTSTEFLKYLDSLGLMLGSSLKVLERIEYDGSLNIQLENKKQLSISQQVAKNLLVSSTN